MNPKNDRDLKRLRSAVRQSRRDMEKFRENRTEAVRQYVGRHYGDSGAEQKVPTNLIELAVNIYVRQLVAQNPQTLIETAHASLKPTAKRLEQATNRLLKKIDFDEELRRVVLDALFVIGVMKVGLQGEGGGEPFVEQIDYDDFVIDMAVKRYRQVSYVGDVFRVPLEEAKSNDLYTKKVREKLTATDRRTHDEEGVERTESISHADGSDQDEYEDHIDLMDLYLPREQLLVTVPVEQEDLVLRVDDYLGGRLPYRFLDFYRVPGNLMPLAPMALWRDLHDLANQLFRKIGHQAEREKTVGIARTDSATDAERVRDANDGQIVLCDNPDAVRELRFGGADPGTLAAFLKTQDLFSWFAGNLESIGGLSPQADTATQEKLVHASAAGRVAQMQEYTVSFVRKAVGDLAWLLWTHPTATYQLIQNIPGTDMSIPDELRPEDRRGSLDDYDIDIEPYSMQSQTPGEKLGFLLQFWTQVVLPMMPVMAQQGITPDFEGFFRRVAKLKNMKELEDILIFSSPTEGGGGEQQARQSPNTTRTYERKNIPGASRQGNDQTMGQILQGAGVQPDQAAALNRRAG